MNFPIQLDPRLEFSNSRDDIIRLNTLIPKINIRNDDAYRNILKIEWFIGLFWYMICPAPLLGFCMNFPIQLNPRVFLQVLGNIFPVIAIKKKGTLYTGFNSPCEWNKNTNVWRGKNSRLSNACIKLMIEVEVSFARGRSNSQKMCT